MDDKEFPSTISDAQRAKLEELLAAKNGKGGANQLEAKQFTEAWIAYAKTVGVNDETVGILYEGFQFAAGGPFYRYARESQDNVAYTSLFAAKPTRANEKGVALKVALNLLALELSAPTSGDSVRLIVHEIPKLSKNRDGKPFGTIGRVIGRILIKPLARKRIDEGISISGKDAVLVLSFIRSPIEKYAQNPKTKSREVDAAMQLLAWFDGQASINKLDEGRRNIESSSHPTDIEEGELSEDEPTKASDDLSSTAKESPKVGRPITSRPVRISRIEPTVNQKGQEHNLSSELQSDETQVPEQDGETKKPGVKDDGLSITRVLEFLAKYKDEYEQLIRSNERLRAERRASELRIASMKQELRKAREDIASLRERVSDLSDRCTVLQNETTTLRMSNETLTGDLTAAEEMLSMIDQRDERQTDESTKRLASELRTEYMDFLDASDIDMDVELGENMRDQLKNVFDILKSNGIEI